MAERADVPGTSPAEAPAPKKSKKQKVGSFLAQLSDQISPALALYGLGTGGIGNLPALASLGIMAGRKKYGWGAAKKPAAQPKGAEGLGPPTPKGKGKKTPTPIAPIPNPTMQSANRGPKVGTESPLSLDITPTGPPGVWKHPWWISDF